MSHSTHIPVVGITSYGRDEKRRFRVSTDYVDAVRRAGGLPLILPPGESALDELFECLDAVVLSGGGDLAPALYGGPDHPTVYNVDSERDAYELALARRIVRTGRPTLAICRGTQLINVALGGSLVTHLPDVVGEAIAHREPDPDGPPGETRPVRHAVSVLRGSRLHQVLATQSTVPASWHHQAIARVAPGLRIAANAEDGTIEAVEMDSHPWLIGVQWHPEITAADDPVQQRLFDALVAHARRPRPPRRG